MADKDKEKEKGRQPTIGDYYVVAKMSGLVRDKTIAKALGLTVKKIREMRKEGILGKHK